ncbi:alpha/beta fold hydrolase [Microbacterium sp. NPDC056044]|uniref:alpha/beta fold hydrolase n=1 Tax=Microbacterium sp. NPDC056044 TaxID=3345690 RepID=UPI0035DB142F
MRDTGGDGPALVLLHGWGQTQAMFRGQVAGLAPARRVVTYDMRGHGVSAKPGHGYRIARLAADLRDVLDALGIERADLLGWSMGASVIWSYLELFGAGRVRSLVLVDQPAAVVAVPWMTEGEQAAAGSILPVDGLTALGGAIHGDDSGDVVRAFVRSMFTGDVDDGLWDFVAGEIAQTPPSAAVPLLFDHGVQDWRDVLPNIALPTLVVGSEGSHVSPDSQRAVAERIPGARLHVFPREVASSHFPFLENPAAFNAVVTTFLDEEAAVATSVQRSADTLSESDDARRS